jgi:aminopeptidase N
MIQIHYRRTAVLLTLLMFFGSLSARDLNDVWSRPVQVEPSRDFDILQYRITLDFDLENKRFEGSNRIRFVPLVTDLKEIRLHSEGLIVSKVVDPEGKALQFELSDGFLWIRLPVSHGLDETVDIEIEYSGSDPEKGLYFDGPNDRHPLIVTTDSWPDEARFWYPCYDHPHDKVTAEMIITVPSGNKVLSNGQLVGSRAGSEPGTETWHWKQDRPISTYLTMLAIGPYVRLEDSFEDLSLCYWVFEGDEENAWRVFRDTPQMVKFFNDLYGYGYPWAKYDQVLSPRQGGGAEATSATLLGMKAIHDTDPVQDLNWERIIAHELAHQWWGDLVTLRSWEHTWMNESFATYSDYLYINYSRGKDVGDWVLDGKVNQYLEEAHTRYMRPIVFNRYNQPGENFDAHTYPKGAVVLHQLRWILGDQVFFRVLNRFLHKHAFEVVDTHDFMSVVKDVSGRNMDWYFEQCVFKPGHPVFNLSYRWDSLEKLVELTVRQVQDFERGVPVYTLPVRVGITTAGGSESYLVQVKDVEETFTFNTAEKPLMVRFDEGNHLLKELVFTKSREELIYQLRNDDVPGRLWATEQLGQHLEAAVVEEALQNAAKEDPFPAIREVIEKMLSERVEQLEN